MRRTVDTFTARAQRVRCGINCAVQVAPWYLRGSTHSGWFVAAQLPATSILTALRPFVAARMTEEAVSLTREVKTVTAVRISGALDAQGFPSETAWQQAWPIRFAQDWRGQHADPQRETEARVLWSPEMLFFRFVAHYRNIHIFDDGEPDGRRDQLWNRDVAEVFLQPAELRGRHYKEFEVSPNGFWIDLEIMPESKRFLNSGLRRRAKISEETHTWEAQLAIPMRALTANFNPKKTWRVNFYRVEGPAEPRFYAAWQPTRTEVPNFHVPEAFGRLVFES